MQITVLALVCLILSSTLASGCCGIQAQEDELDLDQFNFSAYRWDENNTTGLQKLSDEESEAILESLLDSSWVGNNTTYIQRVPDEKAGTMLRGLLDPRWDGNNTTGLQRISDEESEAIIGPMGAGLTIWTVGCVFVLFTLSPSPTLILVDYELCQMLEKRVKESMGGAGFTCKCGVDYTKAMHARDCCASVKTECSRGKCEQHFGNCEGGCDEICASQWESGDETTRPHWKHNICNIHKRR